jgi:hypothetical protein
MKGKAVESMSPRQNKRINVAVGVFALVVAASVSKPAFADTIDIYDGNGLEFAPLNTFFTGQGNTVNQITSSFTSLAGAQFVILGVPGYAYYLSAAQIATVDAYVEGGGRLLINSEWTGYCPGCISETNTILASLGSSIVNAATSSNGGFHDTTDIVANPFTAGVSDVNYADTSSLVAGGTALVYGNPITDDGQEFIAYQGIGAGDVFVIADSNTADNINSTTTNNNGVLYCDFGGLACAGTAAPVPEPSSVLLFGTLLAGAALALKRKLVS